MIGPPPADEAVKELMESVASCCNRRQFTDFMSHFTARRASAIRGLNTNLAVFVLAKLGVGDDVHQNGNQVLNSHVRGSFPCLDFQEINRINGTEGRRHWPF